MGMDRLTEDQEEPAETKKRKKTKKKKKKRWRTEDHKEPVSALQVRCKLCVFVYVCIPMCVWSDYSNISV